MPLPTRRTGKLRVTSRAITEDDKKFQAFNTLRRVSTDKGPMFRSFYVKKPSIHRS